MAGLALLGAPVLGCMLGVCTQNKRCECWLYRDDIGMRRGIKGYEEQAMIDKFHWPFERFFGTHSA